MIDDGHVFRQLFHCCFCARTGDYDDVDRTRLPSARLGSAGGTRAGMERAGTAVNLNDNTRLVSRPTDDLIEVEVPLRPWDAALILLAEMRSDE